MYLLNISPCLLLLLICYHVNVLSADIQISFLVSQWNTCGNADNVFLKILGISITGCVLECAIRPRCKAVNFKGRIFCELLHSDSSTDQAHCDCVRKSAMVVSGIPCQGCNDRQGCDLPSGQCIYTECMRPVVTNGTLFGNKYSIGGMLRLRCDSGFKEVNKRTAVCLENGTWSHLLYCIKDSTANDAESESQAPTETTTFTVTETTAESTTDSVTEATPDPGETTNDCYSISAQTSNDWCMNNCNHVPIYCPADLCQCN